MIFVLENGVFCVKTGLDYFEDGILKIILCTYT